jgi:hypothetical protein
MRLKSLSTRGAALMIILWLALSILSCPAYGQQENYVVKSERHVDVPGPQTSNNVDGAKVRQNWGKLKKGLSPAEVTRLFGAPHRVASSMYDDSTTWFYDDHYVVFDNIKGKVRWWEVDPPAPR